MPTVAPASALRSATRFVPLLGALVCLLWGGVPRAASGDARREDPPSATPVNPDDYPGKVRVACVGDSITFGAGIKDREHASYPAQLGRRLGDKWEVRNFGHSGATLLKNGDSPYVRTKEYPAALAFKPDVVIIFLGTNDSKPQNWKHKDDYAGDYKDLISDFRKADAKVRVYVCLPVPAPPPGNFGIRDEVIKGEIIPLIRTVAAETKAAVIDLYGALNDKSELFPDKVHPNAAGAELMADEVYHALTGKAAPVERHG